MEKGKKDKKMAKRKDGYDRRKNGSRGQKK